MIQTGAAARPAIAVETVVAAGDWPKRAELARLARRAVAATAAHLPVVPGAEVTVTFTDDAAIRDLNARWRGRDVATDVLSFPAAPPRGGRYGPLLGDIVLARETVARDAAALGLTERDHVTHLIVHGLLHLVGHDHLADDEAEEMERLERAVLAGLGIADPHDGAN